MLARRPRPKRRRPTRPKRIDDLRGCLGDDHHLVEFADMEAVGSNPARIIPAWRDFVDRPVHRGRRLRGIGEPFGPVREAAALDECHHHKALLNVAFGSADPLWLVCPYDTATIAPTDIDRAEHNHPLIRHGDAPRDGTGSPSHDFVDVIETISRRVLAAPLAAPSAGTTVRSRAFDASSLHELRSFASTVAEASGFEPKEQASVALAVGEVAANSIRHGGGTGSLRIWTDRGSLLCEVNDHGVVTDVLVGRRRPHNDVVGGRGLWIVNQVCELVQIRSDPSGTTVRLTITPGLIPGVPSAHGAQPDSDRG
jgi:anti-sigma regulatory factor (Ser/Thr protein kinase)